MAEEHDLAFANNAVPKILTPEQQRTSLRIQEVLQRGGIRKSLADVAVETGFVSRDRAIQILQAMNRAAPGSHPPLTARFAVLPIDAQEGTATAAQRAECEQLRAELAKLGYRRALSELLVDKGYVVPPKPEKKESEKATEKRTLETGDGKPLTRPPASAPAVRKPTGAAPAVRKTTVGAAAVPKRPSGTAPAPAVAVAPAKGPSGSLPAARKTTASALAAARKTGSRSGPRLAVPPSKPKNTTIFIGAGVGGGVLILGVVLALALGGKKNEPAPKTEPKTDTPVAKKVSEKKLSEEEEFKQKVEEERKKHIEKEKEREKAWRERKEKEKKEKEEKEKAETVARTERTQKAKDEYEARKKIRLAAAEKRLGEARAALAVDRKAEADKQEKINQRLQGLKTSIRLKNGMQLNDAAVTRVSKDEIELQFKFEGSQAQQSFSWEVLDNPSYLRVIEAIYKADGAAGQFEIGRQCIARKLWKEAQKAFEECVKLDDSFKERVPDLTKILKNEGAFRGSSKRVGKDGILVSYDFSDAEMAEDFKPRSGAKAVVAGGEMKLEGKGSYLWGLKEFEFDKEIDVEMQVLPESNATVLVGCFLNWEGKGYYVGVGPGGVGISRSEPDGHKEVAKKDAYKLPQGAEVKLRILARQGAFKVFANDQEVFAAADATYTKGQLVLGGQGGSLKLKKLLVQGKADPIMIDRIFAEAEVLARRAMEGDLSKKKAEAATEVASLSVEDEYYFTFLNAEQRTEYDKCRAEVVKALSAGRFTDEQLRMFDPFIIQVPEFPAAYYWRGRLKAAIGADEDAHTDYSRALRYAPDFSEAQAALADKMLNDLEYAQATQYVEDALKGRPDYAEVYAVRGFLRFCENVEEAREAGKAEGARDDLELALKLDPDCRLAQGYLRNLVNIQKGPENLGCKFKKEFPHYVLMTDISAEKTKLYGERLEAAFQYYAETFKEFFRDDPKRKKPRVAVFFTKEAYLTYGELTLSHRQEWTLGYFHPMYKELLLFEDADQEETLQTLYHEAFHQFMNMMVGRAPYWYNEGIAEYMGAIKVEKGKKGAEVVQKAGILDGRLKVLKMHLDKALSFKDIMMQSPGQFYAGPVSFKYSQAWSMIHFFYQYEKGKYRALIDAYYRKLKEGGDIGDAYEAAFGEQDMEALQKQWTEYAKALEPAKRS